MAVQARQRGFSVVEEQVLSYDPEQAAFRYVVRSSADVRNRHGNTLVAFDANSGAFRHAYVPTGQYAGDTITSWLTSLHMALVGGLPMRIFVCFMGGVVAALSVTGVLIWLKKRRGRLSSKRARQPIA